jgi:hypothetical protein
VVVGGGGGWAGVLVVEVVWAGLAEICSHCLPNKI